MACMLMFLLKKCEKLLPLTFFQQKYLWIIVLTRTVNILTSNELVKLTMLWTNGPWKLDMFYTSQIVHTSLRLKENKHVFIWQWDRVL